MVSNPAEFKIQQIQYYARRQDKLIPENLHRFLDKRLQAFAPYLDKAHRILEVGCGYAYLGDYLLKTLSKKMLSSTGGSQNNLPCNLQLELVGLDLSYERLRIAAEKGVSVIRGDVCSLPCLDKTFDVVIGNEFLHHVPREERSQCLSEIFRVVKTGGHLLMIEPNRFHPVMIFAGLWMSADRGVFRFSIRDTVQCLKKSGAAYVGVFPFHCLTYPGRSIYPASFKKFFEKLEDMMETSFSAASRLIVARK